MKKILVPVDFSSATPAVLRFAEEQARAFRAELHLLHVRQRNLMPVFPAATVGYPVMGMPDLAIGGSMPLSSLNPAELAAQVPPNEQRTDRLEGLRQQLSNRGLTVEVHEADNDVVQQILQLARHLPADLIVLGTHGHGAVYNLLVGSVTEGVLKARPGPIAVVPAPLESAESSR